ncbi:MAG TPA: glycosyl hydrolase [Acidobacteriota bacterium]|nr:glycosyl hydrolase [Acidobacteriota bacterium]
MISLAIAGLLFLSMTGPRTDELADGFRNPPPAAKPHVYWLWLNGYVDSDTARAELEAMKAAGISGVLLFDMGARGDPSARPPAGPAFLSDPWLDKLRESVTHAKKLGLQVDLSVVSSWDLGGHWIEPHHASMGLYLTETQIEGGRAIDLVLPFPTPSPAAPKGPDGKPAFWRDVAVLAVPNAHRMPGHDFVFRLNPDGVHELREVVLDNGDPRAPSNLAATLTPTREFSVAISTRGVRESDFTEVIRGSLPAGPGAQTFRFPPGSKARYVRLRLLGGHHPARTRLTLGEFMVLDREGTNVVAARSADRTRTGAILVHGSPALSHDESWNQQNLHDGTANGPTGVFASAGLPPLAIPDPGDLVDLTALVDRTGRLRWTPPDGTWTLLRFVCMNTGERLKVPSPASDGWATDHLNADATRAHMEYVISRLRTVFPDLASSGLVNLYLASYEVRGPVWSPTFTEEFERRRGYDMTRFLPVIFGARIGDEETAERFLFDYRKTLGEVLVDAYYRAAREVAHRAGLGIKSEAGGPGPPVHNVPVDSLLANSAVDEIQGEFWPFWPDADGMWVVKETATAGHIYGKPRVHMEAFTSFEAWREGPQDLKPSADRVFCEGGNHMVWHTWSHAPKEAGTPGWVYLAGTHLNRNVTWWPKAGPFLDYLARASYLLQRGQFVADVLYYYGDGGYNFVGPRKNDPSLGPGYDYDVTNSDVILNRLTVRDGRLTLPDGTSYALLVLPETQEAHPAVLAKIEKLVADGATVVGPKPLRACGLEGFPESDKRVRTIADRLWGQAGNDEGKGISSGKGRVISGARLRDVLAAMKVAPDVIAPETLDFIHRWDGGVEIYFIRNKTDKTIQSEVSFWVSQRRPEFWDPSSGDISFAAVYRAEGERVIVPLTLDPFGAIFVVFREPAESNPIKAVSPGAEILMQARTPVLRAEKNGTYRVERANGATVSVEVSGLPQPIELNRGWEVMFEGLAAPGKLRFDELTSWTAHPDQAVRFFSGTARYRKVFELGGEWRTGADRKILLDLGRLWTIAEAYLNGKKLGIVWAPPFRVDCSEAVKTGQNELIIEVTNTWYNRLAGDARRPPAERLTRTNVTTSGGKPWAELEPLESGLLGPVRLLAIAQKEVKGGPR